MKPKLKLGRPVLAGDTHTEPLIVKGKYLYPGLNCHYILSDNNQKMYWYRHVKIDLSAPPMHGDEVEWKHYSGKWASGTAKYIGQKSDGIHVVEYQCGNVLNCTEVRFPKQSKWDRVRELIESDLFSVNTIIDQIDYIYRDES